MNRQNYLSVNGLGKSFGERILFQDVAFGLDYGDKTALIANNGTGKTTLLNIIAGLDTPDSGEVVLRDGIRIGYLEQEPDFAGDITISELLKTSHNRILKVVRRYEDAIERQRTDHGAEAQRELEAATTEMDRNNAWDYEDRAKSILRKFRIENVDQPIRELSGGQRKRLALALVLLDNPDILILDEPTNHLDIGMVEWLEDFLKQPGVTLFMVTHDRYFLDGVCDHIIEMSGERVYQHDGNYSYFLQKRAEREEVEKTEIGKAKKLMKKELEWLRRSPKARTTKSKSRIREYDNIEAKAKSGKAKQELELDVKMERIGGKVLELKKVYKSYGNHVILKGFDYTFKKGERIGIVGKNGEGKSTFLNIITGKEEADSGKVNVGDTISFGYYSQEGINLKEDKRVIDVLKEVADVIVMADGRKVSASQFLEHFLFEPEKQHTFVSKLSGGEKRRLHLLMVLMRNPNFLILDEPTNDLDLITLTKLEEFLLNYGGCLILVSHDRYCLDVLADHLFVFEGDGVIRDYYKTYSEYRAEKVESDRQAELSRKKQSTEKKKTNSKRNLTYGERLEMEELEKEIDAIDREKEELELSLAEASTDFEKVNDLSHKIGELMKSSEEKTERWMELQEKKEG